MKKHFHCGCHFGKISAVRDRLKLTTEFFLRGALDLVQKRLICWIAPVERLLVAAEHCRNGAQEWQTNRALIRRLENEEFRNLVECICYIFSLKTGVLTLK